MLMFLCRRLAAAAIMVAIASTLVFFLIHLLPGDPALLLLGEQGASNPEVVGRLRQKLNLDAPLPTQYVRWVGRIVRGDLGESFQTGLPVAQEVARRIPRSLELIVAGLVFAVAVGIPLGILGARRPNALGGWLSSAIAVVGFSSPSFVTGILLIIGFSLWLQLLPSSGYIPPLENPVQHLRHAILPSLTIGTNFMGVVTRMTRASVMDVLVKDYVRTARAKGLSDRLATYRHALPNSLIPVIAIVGVRAGNLLGGMVIIEALFDWPGLSSLLVRACFDRDYLMIQGALLAIFVIFVLFSLLVDLCQGLIDPQLRHA
ncbi:MAG: ABC transporter permease [candidate division NC10 bacterium]|nr:ABC transporter permease [candidate division NC10 bacterium]MBI2114616.1 ABC transporter permease [candidate division NC10 bacterium]MBI2164338.1 ABC transporter permease [candidate division NC10 bacterium]MBI2456452.1 ABC transporter permease [candidate division NC10 bacterium]